MKTIDLGRDFNQREYWKYHLKILMGIYTQIKRVADSLEETEEVVRIKEESSDPN